MILLIRDSFIPAFVGLEKTLRSKLEEVKNLGFDNYFIRMWKMYLNYCEAAFLTRNINLHQLVFTRDQNIDLNKGLIA